LPKGHSGPCYAARLCFVLRFAFSRSWNPRRSTMPGGNRRSTATFADGCWRGCSAVARQSSHSSWASVWVTMDNCFGSGSMGPPPPHTKWGRFLRRWPAYIEKPPSAFRLARAVLNALTVPTFTLSISYRQLISFEQRRPTAFSAAQQCYSNDAREDACL
jgi:hypothetical protein